MSRSEVFAALHTALLLGYALAALEAAEQDPPALETARGFTLLARDCPLRLRPSAGEGEAIELAANGINGYGLRNGDEIIQLAAFADRSHAAGRHRAIRRDRGQAAARTG